LQSTPESARRIDIDPDWPSPCINTTTLDSTNHAVWTPAEQTPRQTFENVETALNITLHKDIKDFYTLFWSDNLPAKAPRGACELLQPWNEDDFARLQENLIGHIMMKQRLNQAETLFFGLTDEDGFILSVDNATGKVMLEQVGREPKQVLAESLSEFIGQLKV
jgi:SecY interacting protein Syd